MDSSEQTDQTSSIRVVASELGIAVNTLKRFLDWNPGLLRIVQKTKGGHWRIKDDSNSRAKLSGSLMIWSFWARKGIDRPAVRTRKSGITRRSKIHQKPSKMRERQDEFEKLRWGLICEHANGFVFSVDDYNRYRELALAKKPEDPSEDPFVLPMQIEAAFSSRDQATWNALILFLAVRRLRQKYGIDPTVAALAEAMKISRASLYRQFGSKRLQVLLKPDLGRRYQKHRETARRVRQHVPESSVDSDDLEE